ncbi:MAG: secretin N-terminal domain-containing protein [Pseudomonadota bacterium]
MLQSRLVTVLAIVFLVSFTSACAVAQSAPEAPSSATKESRQTATTQGKTRSARLRRTTPITSVIKEVTANSGQRFLLDYRVPNGIVVGPTGFADMEYDAFLSVLDNNDLAAVTTGDYVTVLPKKGVRQAAIPVLKDGETAAPGAWVTRVFALQHLPAPQLVPVLRPLMPTSAHLAAQGNANALIVVDRYANTERLRQVIEQLDTPAAKR